MEAQAAAICRMTLRYVLGPVCTGVVWCPPWQARLADPAGLVFGLFQGTRFGRCGRRVVGLAGAGYARSWGLLAHRWVMRG